MPEETEEVPDAKHSAPTLALRPPCPPRVCARLRAHSAYCTGLSESPVQRAHTARSFYRLSQTTRFKIPIVAHSSILVAPRVRSIA